MAVINIDYKKVQEEIIPALEKELATLKTEVEFYDKSQEIKKDENEKNNFNSIEGRYESIQQQIKWLKNTCDEYQNIVLNFSESIKTISIPTIKKPPFSVN